MTEQLMTLEYHGTGRVMLSDFYKPALEGVWTFKENAAYLRASGALDESDPKHPSVMIPNYVYSPSNCIGASGFYQICCNNKCEGLLGYLEENIGSPNAKPETIVALVSNLSSHTVTAPQKLSTSLLSRLDDIATTHVGTVPLHGRLFAQWMHHVYPRECPYPHLSGTTRDWKGYAELMGIDSVATDEEMKKHVDLAAKAPDGQVHNDLAVEDMMPWSHEEELFVVRPADHSLQSGGSLWAIVRGIAFLAASSSFVYGMIRTLQPTSKLGSGALLGNEKFMV